MGKEERARGLVFFVLEPGPSTLLGLSPSSWSEWLGGARVSSPAERAGVTQAGECVLAVSWPELSTLIYLTGTWGMSRERVGNELPVFCGLVNGWHKNLTLLGPPCGENLLHVAAKGKM